MSDISFSGVIQRVLPKSVSDHSPVLLEGGGFRNGPSPYRFENMWLKEEGFFDLVKGWWLSWISLVCQLYSGVKAESLETVFEKLEQRHVCQCLSKERGGF